MRACVALVTLACLAACESPHDVPIAVTAVDSTPLAGAIAAVICRLDGTVDGAAATTDAAGLATVTLIQRDSRELTACELTVAAAGYVTEQRAIDLCGEDCAVSVTLAVEP